MRSLKRHVSSIAIAAWVITLVFAAIAYELCLGTAEAVSPHGQDTAQRS